MEQNTHVLGICGRIHPQTNVHLFTLQGGGQRCGRKHLPLFLLTLFKAWPVPRPQLGIHYIILGVRGSEPPPDAVFVFDILGNSSARFKQEDGGSLLPIKLNGSFHLMGELEMMQHKHIEQALSPF
jgi:hypothetical protein